MSSTCAWSIGSGALFAACATHPRARLLVRELFGNQLEGSIPSSIGSLTILNTLHAASTPAQRSAILATSLTLHAEFLVLTGYLVLSQHP